VSPRAPVDAILEPKRDHVLAVRTDDERRVQGTVELVRTRVDHLATNDRSGGRWRNRAYPYCFDGPEVALNWLFPDLNFFDSAQCLMVRRWRLIGHFPILHNPYMF
jgi:hypothetical protein